jgi:hypothetical protein
MNSLKENYRRKIVLLSAVIALPIVLGACVSNSNVDESSSPLPLAQKVVPEWANAYQTLGSDVVNHLSMLEQFIPDPLIRESVGEVLIENAIASVPGGKLDQHEILRKAGRVLGYAGCSDSRVVCDTVFYSASAKEDFIIEEAKSLGGAPRIFEKGVNISILSTHSTCIGVSEGCGALGALKELLSNPEAKAKFIKHGIPSQTIEEILKSLESANPTDQAVIGAKIQAKFNYLAHGGDSHVAVAVQAGHADGKMEILGAFNEKGAEVKVPSLARDFVFVQNNISDEIVAGLAEGQKPFLAVINATGLPTADLMGTKALEPGQIFKVTGEIRNGVLSANEVDRILAGIGYPLAHDWGKVLWIFAKNEEELSLIENRLLRSSIANEFLKRNGVILSAVVDEKGKIIGNIFLSQLKSAEKSVDAALTFEATSSHLVVSSNRISLSELVEQNALVSIAQTNDGALTASRWKEALSKIKQISSKTLKIASASADLLKPFFDAGWYMLLDEAYEKLSKMGPVFDNFDHQITISVPREQFDSFLKIESNVDPRLVILKDGRGLFQTKYTKDELSEQFFGYLNAWADDFSQNKREGDSWANGQSGNSNSQFYEVGNDNLFKIFVFGFQTPSVNNSEYDIVRLSGAKSPVVFFPIGMELKNSEKTPVSPNHIDLSQDGLKKQPFMVVDTQTGEYLITGTEGQIVVEVRSNKLYNNVPISYFLMLTSHNDGSIDVQNVGYFDPTKK